tara:strand:+ start:582 stop:1097 length:516 start_codon:yes stop_codon:yes gene_type:complete
MDTLINKVYDNITDYIDNSCIQETTGSWPSIAKESKEILLLDLSLNNTERYLKADQIHPAYDSAISFNEMRKQPFTKGMILITVGDGNSLKLIQLHVTEIENGYNTTSVQIYQKSWAASWVVGCQECTITFTLGINGLNIKMTGGKINMTRNCDYLEAFYFVPDKKMCIKF